MKFHLMIISSAIVLAGALMLVEAGRYNSHSQQNTRGHYNNHQAANYHNTNNNNNNNYPGRHSPYGPYHSYAVRPAIYGGHGLYHYKGYARHPIAPATYKRQRSHGGASRYGHGGQQQQHHYRATRSNYGAQRGHYGLRPVNALVLAPAYSYGPNHGSSAYGNGASSYSHPNSHYPPTNYQSSSNHHRQQANHGSY